MGIHVTDSRLLLRAKADGVSFESVATLGRQTLFLSRKNLLAALQNLTEVPAGLATELTAPNTCYADIFFRILGAKEIVAVDASGYEGATVILDLNRAIPKELEARFDVVFDGGTLEHVFNFPQAILNCMRMVKPGGRFISVAPANNWFGHGFYQFSPELFYRVLAPGNGFQIEKMFTWENITGSPLYSVPDPKCLEMRLQFMARAPLSLFVQAIKSGNSVSTYFPSVPMQSDYVAAWKKSDGSKSHHRMFSNRRWERPSNLFVRWWVALNGFVRWRRALHRSRLHRHPVMRKNRLEGFRVGVWE
jgi:SAM-dependent methyltransferase